MKHTAKIISLTIGLAFSVASADACTSIIITGKATPDGRPIMWKHRDTSVDYNHIVFEKGEKYDYIGLANSNLDGDIWIGTNNSGFSIMNTASYNLKDDDVEVMDHEGKLMKRALEICSSAKDFENFLDTLSRPMRVEANFGIIDAHGGAAYYETNNTRYYKKDVNDKSLAPDGYLIYTNFSFEGRKDEGYGFVRYESARKIFGEMKEKGFTPLNIFNDASSSFYHSLMKTDLRKPENSPNRLTSGWALEQDFIPRNESTASIVIQGVKEGMNPELSVMWTELGYPPTAIAVPLLVGMGNNLPEMVKYNEKFKTAPLCFYSTAVKKQAYPIHKGNGQKYIHWELMWNDSGNGYLQTIEPCREKVYNMFKSTQNEWGGKSLNLDKIYSIYQEAETVIEDCYNGLIEEKLQ